MNTYEFKDENGKSHVLFARNHRSARRRFRGFIRGELDIDGNTIPAKKRKPPGRSMNLNLMARLLLEAL
jgi:hypothetical protein